MTTIYLRIQSFLSEIINYSSGEYPPLLKNLFAKMSGKERELFLFFCENLAIDDSKITPKDREVLENSNFFILKTYYWGARKNYWAFFLHEKDLEF